MTKSKVVIIISVIMKFPPREFKNCYIGIASENDSDIEKSISLKNAEMLFEKAPSHLVAKELEEKFLKLGMNCAPQKSSENSDVVFVYKLNGKLPDKN